MINAKYRLRYSLLFFRVYFFCYSNFTTLLFLEYFTFLLLFNTFLILYSKKYPTFLLLFYYAIKKSILLFYYFFNTLLKKYLTFLLLFLKTYSYLSYGSQVSFLLLFWLAQFSSSFQSFQLLYSFLVLILIRICYYHQEYFHKFW